MNSASSSVVAGLPRSLRIEDAAAAEEEADDDGDSEQDRDESENAEDELRSLGLLADVTLRIVPGDVRVVVNSR